MESFIGPLELEFIIVLLLSVGAGLVIGVERESRGKDAGISTHILVISGAALFTLMSAIVDPMSTSRIASQIVPGIGFLGAGLILKDGVTVKNLTTAASLWFAAALGMAIGYGFYVVAIIGALVCAIIPRIPSLHKHSV
ncbi:MAG TPA: MgtC/SapB family protein [Candidatus Paceibacterota bacterium]|nr:MgtC/SapB family protein [Candidatus Paceibacterota bacterium]